MHVQLFLWLLSWNLWCSGSEADEILLSLPMWTREKCVNDSAPTATLTELAFGRLLSNAPMGTGCHLWKIFLQTHASKALFNLNVIHLCHRTIKKGVVSTQLHLTFIISKAWALAVEVIISVCTLSLSAPGSFIHIYKWSMGHNGIEWERLISFRWHALLWAPCPNEISAALWDVRVITCSSTALF